MTYSRRRHDGKTSDYEGSSILVGILAVAILGIVAGIVVGAVIAIISKIML